MQNQINLEMRPAKENKKIIQSLDTFLLIKKAKSIFILKNKRLAKMSVGVQQTIME